MQTTYQDYRHNLQLYRQLFDFHPDTVVVDKHPNYLSTELGRSIAAEEGVQLIEVQHHHAHITACMAEHGLPLDTGKVWGWRWTGWVMARMKHFGVGSF